MTKSELLARTEHEDQIRSVRSDDASNRITEQSRQSAACSEQLLEPLALTIRHSKWLVQESGRIRQVHKYSIFLPHKHKKELA